MVKMGKWAFGACCSLDMGRTRAWIAPLVPWYKHRMFAPAVSETEYRRLLTRLSFRLGALIGMFVFAVHALSIVSLFAFDGLQAELIITGALLAAPLALSGARLPQRVGGFAADILMLAVCCGLVLTFSSRILDLSYDGQMYHQEAIIQLAGSWNPLRQDFISPGTLGTGMERIATFISYYPKFSWLVGAVFYQAAQSIEAAKAVNLLLLISAGLLTYALCAEILKASRVRAALYAFCFAANPIAATQLFNGYVDGLLASALLVLLISCGFFLKYGGTVSALLLAGSTAAVVNTKLTGLVYAPMLLGAIALWLFFMQHPRFKQFGLLSGAAVCLAALLFGYQPYVTSFLEKGTPMYPVVRYPLSGVTPDADGVFVRQQLPADFVGANRFEKLFRSLSGRSENAVSPQSSTAKPPWSVERREFEVFALPDVRIAGFGPLFALALCGGGLLFLSAVVLRLPHIGMLGLFCGILLGSALINPEAWWARYVPQIVFAPAAVAVFLIEAEKPRLLRGAAYTVLLMLLVNHALVAGSSLSSQLTASGAARRQLEALASSQERVSVVFGHNRALRVRLRDFGVVFAEASSLSCRLPHKLWYSGVRFCSNHE